ncbi:MAG: WD40 repeat domain-containing protein [Gemmataceae bacterium]|nr:WD40 repeat domain-containing protein [Gemmataceae bacterium]
MSRTAWALVLATLPALSLLPAPAGPPVPVKQQPRVDRLGDPLPDGALARLGTRRLRHVGFAGPLIFSPDGKLLASVGADYALRLWDTATGKERHCLGGPEQDHLVHDLAFSPDGKLLASSKGIPNTIRLWDPATGKEVRRWTTPTEAYRLAFAPDGRLASTQHDGSIWLWDPATGKRVGTLPGHRNDVAAITFVRDGKSVVTSGRWDHTIVQRDLASGDELRRFQGLGGAAAVSPNGRLVAAPTGGSIRVWELVSGQRVQQFPAGDPRVTFLAFTPDNRTLVIATEDWALCVLDIPSGKERRTLRAPLENLDGLTAFAALSPDGRIAAAVTPGGTIQLWEVATGKELCPAEGHRGPVAAVAYALGGKRVLTRGPFRDVRVWDPATGREVGRLEGHSEDLLAMAVSPDGKWVASGAGGQDRTIGLWDVATRKEVRRLEVVAPPGFTATRALTFTPDGQGLVSLGDDAIRLWDLASGTPRRRIDGKHFKALAVSPEGRTLATATMRGVVSLWDIPSGREVRQLEGWLGARLVLAFSPDGKTLATAALRQWVEDRGHLDPRAPEDDTIQLWEVQTGESRGRLVGDQKGTTALAFSPDGRYLALGSTDGIVRLWEVPHGTCRELPGHIGEIRGVAFAPDGQTLVSAGADTTALVWDVRAALAQPPRRP